MKNTLFIAILLFTFIGVYAQKTLTPIDNGSKIHFVIKNFGINTGGDFSGMKGDIKFDGTKPYLCSFNVTVEVKTVDTDNESRDTHLKKEEYFDTDKFPEIRMVSTKIQGTNKPNTYMFTGNLTIKGITKPVHFLFTATPKESGYVFSGNFKINRLDFNVGSSSAVMANTVAITITAFAK